MPGGILRGEAKQILGVPPLDEAAKRDGRAPMRDQTNNALN